MAAKGLWRAEWEGWQAQEKKHPSPPSSRWTSEVDMPFKAEGSRRLGMLWLVPCLTEAFHPGLPPPNTTPLRLSVEVQLLPIRTLHEQELRK